jgi:hypothetical protein
MTTVCGNGSSTHTSTKTAALEATRAATASLGGQPPTYGFLFASPHADLGVALATAREASGAEVIGCTTAGEITEKGLTHGGIALLLVAADTTVQMQFAEGLKERPTEVAAMILSGLPDTKKKAAAKDQRYLTTVLLTDGLSKSAC